MNRMAMSRGSKSFYPYLEGLRGIACLIVVFSHTSIEGIHVIPFFDAAYTGKIGVWLFFVMSAFLLTGRLFEVFRKGHDKTHAILRYAVSRAFRILPLFFLVLVAEVALGWITWDRMAAVLLLQDPYGIYWTVGVEMKYYLIIPLIALAAASKPEATTAWALGLLGLALFITAITFSPEHTGATNDLGPFVGIFLFGSAAALACAGPHPKHAISDFWTGSILVVLVLSFPVCINMILLPVNGFHMAPMAIDFFGAVHGLLWAILVAQVFHSEFWQRVFSVALLRFLGQISFSIYLVHALMIRLVLPLGSIPDPVKGPLVLGLTIAVSTITYHLIERPGMRVGRALAEAPTVKTALAGERNLSA